MRNKDQNLIIQSYPKANYLAHKVELKLVIDKVLDSGWYILGNEMEAFENEFARYNNSKHAIGVANGTDALEMSIRACGVGSGDYVIVPSHTAVATAVAVTFAGATPIFVDVDPITYTIDPNHLEFILRTLDQRSSFDINKIKAVVPVHLYGHPTDMTSILDIASRYNLYVIEDCSQAHGGSFKGRKIGAWGHISAFSLYPTKNLGALGDGGCVVTNDSDFAEKVQLFRQYGWEKRYISESLGKNSRLDEVQAAILRVKLKYLDKENERRRKIAKLYNEMLSSTNLVLPVESKLAYHVYHQYVVRSSHRKSLKDYLEVNSIGTSVLYPLPIHLQPVFKRQPIDFDLKHTEKLCREILCLPIHPHISDDQVIHVVELIIRWQKDLIGKN